METALEANESHRISLKFFKTELLKTMYQGVQEAAFINYLNCQLHQFKLRDPQAFMFSFSWLYLIVNYMNYNSIIY